MCPSGTNSAKVAKTRSDSLSGLRLAFDVLDFDHDGRISKEDLSMFYHGLSWSSSSCNAAVDNSLDLDDDVVGTMMSVADTNKNGFVEYEEFERILTRRNGVDNGKKGRSFGVMDDAFEIMDKDGDGKLSYDDLKSFMHSCGFYASDEDIMAMITLAGVVDVKDGVCYQDMIKILAVDHFVA